ncbi:MAG: hypothetical protein ACRDBL_09265 [Rhabdaerophilum sp.]
MRLFFTLVSVVFGVASALYFLEVLTIESSRQSTVFQQIVARVSFGFAVLICILSAGVAAILSRLDALGGFRQTINDIALSNADAAKALKAIDARADQKARTSESSPVSRDAPAVPVTPGGRLAVEAEMLAQRGN